MDKERAYSWVKAARYKNHPFEVGPLARLMLSGEYEMEFQRWIKPLPGHWKRRRLQKL